MKPVQGGEQIWVAFNYLPGGHIVAQHFEDLSGEKKQGDQDLKTVTVTAKEQVEAFKKQENVAINVGGVIKKNDILIYKGASLRNNPKAAVVVIEWAIAQGLTPIRATADQKGDQTKTYEYDKRIGALEGDVADIKKGQEQILAALQNLQPGAPSKN